jgi:GNAT superfamily N-acetyltransferase
MFVLPEARGKGVGRALLQEALIRARRLSGLERVLLDVVVGNESARTLYESLGFVMFGCEPEAKKRGERYVDMMHMTMRL